MWFTYSCISHSLTSSLSLYRFMTLLTLHPRRIKSVMKRVDVGGGTPIPTATLALPYSVKTRAITDTSLARSSAKPRQTLKGGNG